MKPTSKVLLVDDDPMSNMINEKIIHVSNVELKVIRYVDANEALRYLKHLVKTDPGQFPDIVFIDINMPEMDGWEFIEELNKFPEFILNECKVITLTSSIDEEDIQKSKTYKMVYDFISKPLTIDRLEILLTK